MEGFEDGRVDAQRHDQIVNNEDRARGVVRMMVVCIGADIVIGVRPWKYV